MFPIPCVAVVLDDGQVQSFVLQDWPDEIPPPQVAVTDLCTKYVNQDDQENLIYFSIGDEPVSALGHSVTPEVYGHQRLALSPRAVLEAIEKRDARDGKAQVEQSLIHSLTGYLGRDPAHREALRNFPEWPRLARQELERRGARFLEVLPDDALHAIAQGQIDLADLAGKIPDFPD
jgi:hypothetical protein